MKRLFYIQTGKVKLVPKQLAENPKAEICAFKDGTWFRVAGELVKREAIQAGESIPQVQNALNRLKAYQ